MGNIFLMIFITALASLLLGMGLPTTANYIIMASLTAPVIVELATGMSLHGQEIVIPLIAAHLFCFYFGILADDTPPVGLAAYAGAAIAKENPIAVGVQGFLYDIRTVIIPVFFLFNSDILLLGIDTWTEALFIFAMTSIGMIAFTCATQGWVLTRTNIIERVFLLGVTVIMMFPATLTGFFLDYSQRYWGYAAGIALFAFVILMQKMKGQPAKAADLEMPKDLEVQA